MEKLAKNKRPQRGPQPPPTYTSRGNVPDGFVTWNHSKPELRMWADRERCDAWAWVRDTFGVVTLDRSRAGTNAHHLN